MLHLHSLHKSFYSFYYTLQRCLVCTKHCNPNILPTLFPSNPLSLHKILYMQANCLFLLKGKAKKRKIYSKAEKTEVLAFHCASIKCAGLFSGQKIPLLCLCFRVFMIVNVEYFVFLEVQKGSAVNSLYFLRPTFLITHFMKCYFLLKISSDKTNRSSETPEHKSCSAFQSFK